MEKIKEIIRKAYLVEHLIPLILALLFNYLS